MRPWYGVLVWGLMALVQGGLAAQAAPSPSSETAATGIERWLVRLQDAPQDIAYVGTFVVTTGSDMSSSRIWHVGDGQHQMERVESLTGAARTTYRRNDEVVTFLPATHTIIHETRDALGLFPNVLKQTDTSVTRFYRLHTLGQGRVAGLQADIVQLQPVDALRYSYQIWTEQKTGLMLKLQTLDASGKVLEQTAFSELQLDAPVAMAKLKTMMDNTQGFRVTSPQLVKTTAEEEGWVLGATVPGFSPVRCYRRVRDGAAAQATLQCVYSDGMASVSLFAEPFEPSRHARMLSGHPMSLGATSLRLRQIGPWCLTAVGEVPAQTLNLFLQSFERKR